MMEFLNEKALSSSVCLFRTYREMNPFIHFHSHSHSIPGWGAERAKFVVSGGPQRPETALKRGISTRTYQGIYLGTYLR